MENNNAQNQSGSYNVSDNPTPASSSTQTEPSFSSSIVAGASSPSVPPPPSPDERVAIRTMSSDLQSVRETGGQSPQSQIINAPELSKPTSDVVSSVPISSTPPPIFSQQPTTPQPEKDFQQQPIQPSSFAPSVDGGPVSFSDNGQPFVENTKGSFIKTLVWIIVGIMIAGGLGFGAYYLITSLSQSPSLPSDTQNGELPITSSQQAQEDGAVSTSTVVQALTHLSVILTPTDTHTLTITSTTDSNSVITAIASTSLPVLSVGSVRDVSLVDAGGKVIESSVVLPSYFPSFGSALAALVDRDFTTWIYYDKTGGAKLGFVFRLKANTPFEQASLSVGQYIENNTQDIARLFITPTTTPPTITFKDGAVGDQKTKVRFAIYNTKQGNVFEYGWMTGTAGDHYLVLATSYNQMVDILNRMIANPAIIVPTVSTSSTSTVQ